MRPDWLPLGCSYTLPTEDYCLWCRGPSIGRARWTVARPIKTRTTVTWCKECEDKARAYMGMFGPHGGKP